MVKYLDIKIDENLNWKQHVHNIPIKSNFEECLLSHFLCMFKLFKSGMGSPLTCHEQDHQSAKRSLIQISILEILIQFLFFKPIIFLKREYEIINILLISKSLYKLLPSVFNDWFNLCSDVYNCETASS